MTIISNATSTSSETCGLDKPILTKKSKPQSKKPVKISIEKINKLLQSLTPLTQPYLDKEGKTIQLWSSEKRPLFASIQNVEGNIEIIPGYLVKNPLSPSDTEKEIYEKLSKGPLRRWNFTVDTRSKAINIWPHLIAAGRSDVLPKDHIWFRQTPFKSMNAQQVDQYLRSKGFIPKGRDPASGKGAYLHPRTGRHYSIDPQGQGRYKNEPNHVDVHRLKGENLPKRRLAYGNDRTFKETLQSTKLTESYNSSHPKGQIAAKGSRSGQIGGVGNQVGMIKGLFDGPESIHEDEHYFYIPTPEGKMPFTSDQLQQILRELAVGIFVHDTVPFFSLHFNGDSNMFPVIHPAYQNTLVGRVISMLDYHMKGFLNGAFYDEEFIKAWQLNPTQDEATLRDHVIDLHDYCQEHLGPDTHYFTVNEFIENFEKKKESLLSVLAGNKEELPIFKDYSGFRSSFRIIAKQNSVKKGGNVLSPESDFDVLYTISPDPTYEEELRRYRMEHGTDPESYKNLVNAYEAMSQQIKIIMPRLPLFREYFEMLKVINFFCYYYRSMKEANKIPILESKQVDAESISPFLFPFLPRRKCVSQTVEIKHTEAIGKLPAYKIVEVYDFLKSVDSPKASIPDRIIDPIAERYCEIVKSKYPYNLKSHYKRPEYYRETVKNILSDLIRQSVLLKADALQHKDSVEKDLKRNREALITIRKALSGAREEQRVVNERTSEVKALFSFQTVTTTLINSKITSTEKTIADLEGKWFPTNIDKQNLDQAKHNLTVYKSIKELWPTLAEAKSEIDKSIEKLEEAERRLVTSIQGLEKGVQEIRDIDTDPVSETIDRLYCKFPVSGSKIQLFSELTDEERYENKRVVGGVGVNLSNQEITLDPTADRILTNSFHEAQQADDGTLVAVKEDEEVKGQLFKMGFVDFFTSEDSTYARLEGTIEKVQQSLTPETISLFYAIEDGDAMEFLKLHKHPKVNRKAKDPNGVSLLHYAAAASDPVFLRTLLKKGLDLSVVDNFGYNALHYAAREGHLESVQLLIKWAPKLLNAKAKNGATPFYLAVQNGQAAIAEELANAGATVNDATAYGMNPLYCAIFHENEELALKLLNLPMIDVNYATEEGSTALHLAIELGLDKVVSVLMQHGASIHAERKDGYRPIHVAAQFGRLTSIKIMNASGELNPNSLLKSGQTALHIATKHFHHDIVKYLLDNGANPTLCGWDKETPLMVAIKAGNTLSANTMVEDCANALVPTKEGSTVLYRAPDYYGKTPMDIAIENSLFSVIEQLILCGKQLSSEQILKCCEKIDNSLMIAKWIDILPLGSSYIEKALQAAATYGNNKVVCMLMRKYKAAGKFKDNKGRGLIHYAAAHDNITVIRNTIKKNPQALFQKDHEGNTPAMLAAKNGSLRSLKQILQYLDRENKPKEITKLLGSAVQGRNQKSVDAILHKMKDPNTPLNDFNQTALHIAVVDGDVELVAFLKERGCRFDVRDANGMTPFHYAIEYDWEDIQDYLFDKKNELSLPADLLYHAAAKGKPRDIKRLVEEFGVSPNISQSVEGEPVIFGAIRESNFDTFAALLNYGIDPNSEAKDRTTPLYLAARLGRHRFVSYLANNGASVNQKVKGRTPLHIAAAYGHLESVQELILAGADIEEIDTKGKTAKSLAQMYKHDDVVHILSNRSKEFEVKKLAVVNAIKAGDVQRLMQLVNTGPSLPLNKSLAITFEGKHTHAPILQLIYLYCKSEKKKEMMRAFLTKRGVKTDSRSVDGSTIAHLMAKHGECDPAFNNLWLVKCDKGLTPLHYLAAAGTKKELSKMLNDREILDNIDTVDENDVTPLITATAAGKSDNVKMLLQRGANPNTLTKKKLSPLMVAIEYDKSMVMKALLEGGADVNKKCLSVRTTALNMALSMGHIDTIQLLLSYGASTKIADSTGVTPILTAAKTGNIRLLRILHARGSSLYDTDHKGYTVAHHAAQSNNEEMIDYLRANGVSFNEKTVERKAPVVQPKVIVDAGLIPFHIASVRGNYEMMQKLNSIGSNIEAVDNGGESALLYATISGNDGCVKFFEKYRLMKDQKQVSKSVVFAARKDNVPQLEVLVKSDFAIDAPLDPSGKTALHFAAMFGGVHSLLYLIHQGAELSIRTSEGYTAFDLAVMHGQVQTAKLLARFSGVEVNIPTVDGSTHLHQACANADIQMVAFLLKNDPEINAFDENGHTALYVAASKGQVKLVSLLMAAGADATKVSVKGETLLDLIPLRERSYRAKLKKQLQAIETSVANGDKRLHRALRMGDDLSIKFFSNIDDLKENNAKGDTPLHLAMRLGNENAVRNLIREGAEIDRKDNLGRTPLMVAATELYDLKMVKLFLALGADHAISDDLDEAIMQKIVREKPSKMRRAIFNFFYRTIPPNPPMNVENEMIGLIEAGDIGSLMQSIHGGYRTKVKNDTWLHHSVKYKQLDLSCLLIDWFPRLMNVVNDDQQHVLDVAVQSASPEIMAVLLSRLSTEAGDYIVSKAVAGDAELFDALYQVIDPMAEVIEKYSSKNKVSMLKTWFKSAKSRLDILAKWKEIVQQYPELDHPPLDVKDRNALYQVTKGFKVWMEKHDAVVKNV